MCNGLPRRTVDGTRGGVMLDAHRTNGTGTTNADTEIGFRDVDRAADPAHYVEYLDAAIAHPSTEPYRHEVISLLQPHLGEHILEVGCGTGEELRALLPLVGSAGRLVGIDNSQTMVEEARRRSQHTRIDFVVGDAHALEVQSGTFDAARAARTFQHLEDPRRALAELARVVRPGGRVVLAEPDWDTLVIDSPDQDLTRQLIHGHADSIRQPWIGRQLPALFEDVGLSGVQVRPTPLIMRDYASAEWAFFHDATRRAVDAGRSSRLEIEQWQERLRKADREGRFFLSIIVFVVAGRRV
jgi:SAM-dependent methyltransferase